MDYHSLNSKKINDKFSIPIIKELLDELFGAKFFTNLDLGAGYHQIRMDPGSISFTKLRKHHVHFEFMVISFGLTKSPSTFQTLMNLVFHNYQLKFF